MDSVWLLLLLLFAIEDQASLPSLSSIVDPTAFNFFSKSTHEMSKPLHQAQVTAVVSKHQQTLF